MFCKLFTKISLTLRSEFGEVCPYGFFLSFRLIRNYSRFVIFIIFFIYMSSESYHIPALLPEAIEGLAIRPGGVYVDCTFGGGGHTRGILSALAESGRVYGFDRDKEALGNAPEDSRFTFVHSDFRYLSNWMDYHGEEGVDGILADLGVSFHHFDKAERGFSFRSDAPLDMRMNQSAGITAAELLEESDERRLADIFRTYTDLRQSGQLAKAIVTARDHSPILTTFELAEVARKVIPPQREKKELAQVFQALRIAVNDEMGSLRQMLEESLQVLKPGGRLAIITYHSIEDRIVKNFFRSGTLDGEVEKDLYGNVKTPWKLITRNPIVPSAEEVERNPRSRSAKLRIAEKKKDVRF